MTDDKKCCGSPSCNKLVIFLVGLVVGGIIMGVFAMFGRLDFLSGAVMQSKPSGTQPGVLIQQNADGSWYKSSESTVAGTWVKVTTGSSVKLASGQAFQTEDGEEVELSSDAWLQTYDVSWAQFADTTTVLKQGAWVKLPNDMEFKGKAGKVTLPKGTTVQLLSNANVDLEERSSDAEITPL